MTDYVILVRNPTSGTVFGVTDGDGDDPPMATYATEDEAENAAQHTTVCQAWPYSIVEAP